MAIVFIYFISMATVAYPLDSTTPVGDLRKEWKTLDKKGLQNYSENARDHVNTIYFTFDPEQYKGRNLHVESATPFSLFLNHQLLVCKQHAVTLNVDSLLGWYPAPWLWGVFQKEKITELRTVLENPNPWIPVYFDPLRPVSLFMNFFIFASFIVLICLVVLMRINTIPSLNSLMRHNLFSVPERKNTFFSSIFFSKVSISYYVFIGLLSSFVWLILFQFSSHEVLQGIEFPIRSVAEGFYQWGILFMTVIGFLLVKFIVLFIASSLFKFENNILTQFQGYIKLSFFTFGLAGLFCLGYFICKVKSGQAYDLLVYGIVFLFVGWVIFIGIRLFKQFSFSFFHLFSYLCLSEFIPALIMVKILHL